MTTVYIKLLSMSTNKVNNNSKGDSHAQSLLSNISIHFLNVLHNIDTLNTKLIQDLHSNVLDIQ